MEILTVWHPQNVTLKDFFGGVACPFSIYIHDASPFPD
jgi:hypothetical protein